MASLFMSDPIVDWRKAEEERVARQHHIVTPEYRKELLEKLRVEVILGKAEPTYEGNFDGGGDSGNYSYDSGREDVDEFFSALIDKHVTFDWYNGDGGHGDITWDLATDTITINGYERETVSNTVMDAEKI